MAEKLPFGEGASINRPPLFCCLKYQFWKVRMKIFVESLDRGIWDAIENGPFFPMFEKDNVFFEKPWSQWTESESKRAKFNCIAKNIITSDVIPLAIWRMILDILRNHLELYIIEALFLELDHCSKTRTHQKLVPNPKLILMFHILSN